MVVDIGVQILLQGLILPLSLPISLWVVRGTQSALNPKVMA